MNPLSPKLESRLTEVVHSAFAQSGTASTVTAVTAEGPLLENPQWQSVLLRGSEQLIIFLAYDTDGNKDLITLAKKLEGAMGEFARLLGSTFNINFDDVEIEAAKEPPSALVQWTIQSSEENLSLVLALDGPAVEWINTKGLPDDLALKNTLLDSLLDVELPVSVRLAARSASLDEVLTWSPGATVEFDGNLDDPVEVIVNRKIVARGAIVIVNGNYGVRVTEVLDP